VTDKIPIRLSGSAWSAWLRNYKPQHYRYPRRAGGVDPIGTWTGKTRWLDDRGNVIKSTPARFVFLRWHIRIILDETRKHEKMIWIPPYKLQKNSQVIDTEIVYGFKEPEHPSVAVGEAWEQQRLEKEPVFSMQGLTCAEPKDWEHRGGYIFSPPCISFGKRFSLALTRESYLYPWKYKNLDNWQTQI